jgi:putative phosphoserine phosphatase/1-acylglycerol-3-phosphate O-acyltransferase
MNLPKINESIQKVIDNNNSIMIFPEGTRSNQKALLPFKKGAAHIAKQFNLPIIPVVTHNAHELMVKGGVWLKSGDIDIQILEPITDVQSYGVDELTDLLFQIVNEQLTT